MREVHDPRSPGLDFGVLGGSPELFLVNLPIVKLLLAQARESTDPQRQQDRLDRLRELVTEAD